MIKKGFLANGEMLGWEPEKLCSFIKETGYDSVELIGDIIFAEGKDGRAFRAAADKAGITISEILAQHDYVTLDEQQRKDSVKITVEQIRRAADIGVDVVNLFTGPVPWMPDSIRVGAQISMTDAWAKVFASFDEILPVAEKLGVKIAVENVWGMLTHDFYTNQFLVNHYGSDFLGVNLDPSHDVLYGNTDAAFIVKSWGKKIFHVHVKDAVGIAEPGKFVFPLLEEGCVDFKGFFDALKEIGYEGTASVEFESWGYRAKVMGGLHAAAAAPSLEMLKKYI
ncbi:MAG: sugar phosphate isomerase/epimerase [Clostridia bacterium]|nr:sugar phosphate isomerase/epimerase [Clostridia bacterium]